ncbi:MAG: hypothetical protein K2H84_03230, partial [Paramuribaculum sp.]|nr:hypothetical protein [Paramuribaculum sp.]
MKKFLLYIFWALSATAPLTAQAQEIDTLAVFSEFGPEPDAAAIMNEKVIVGKDTVSMILPQRNFGRYDRGLFNFLFIPKGQWTFGLMASYGEFNSDDVQILNAIKDFTFKGKLYSIKPSFGYFIGNNQSIGLKLNYTRGEASLGGLTVDIDEDMNFSLKDVSYFSNSYAIGVFYRTYVGLSAMKRFGVFNDVDLSFGNSSSRFKRYYSGELRDTRTNATSVSLNFSPGVCVFIMENVSFNVSFGVFGLQVRHEKQLTDGIEEGSRTSSGANF